MPAVMPLTEPDSLDIGALFDAHAEDLCRMVHRMTGSREAAEEVVQDVFVTAWRRRDDLNDPAHVRTWLYRVAVNHVRHRRRAHARLGAFLERWMVRPVDEASSPLDKTMQRENAERIQRCVAELSPKLREVFVLYELQEMTGVQIAEVLDIKSNTVWGRLRLARAAFAEAWKRLEEDS